LKLWNTKPSVSLRIRASSLRGRPPTSRPASRYAPRDGRSRQPITFINVDFPDPDAPITATNWPAVICSETSSSARSSVSPVA
jgi:hypothetical protein